MTQQRTLRVWLHKLGLHWWSKWGISPSKGKLGAFNLELRYCYLCSKEQERFPNYPNFIMDKGYP
jgi:hypothetical protein